MGRTFQVAELAEAKAWREEIVQGQGQVASSQLWLSWEALLT